MNMTVFKKHNRKHAVAAVSAFLISLAVSMNVLAWFAKGRDYIPVDTYRGSVRTAYFNGGNGTAPAAGTTADDYKDPGTAYPSYDNDNDTGDSLSGPYQIDNATQLYNFAWLQYLGYFNGENASQTYFVLTSDIDASGLVLPPVGNEDNPFIGNFNGNGYTISGLTVSNDKTELNNASIGDKFSIPHAAMENNELKSDLEIVGLFGVIGDIEENYTASSSAPSVKDLTIRNFTVETVSDNALAGIAAGYVNGRLENITVAGTSTISSSSGTALSSYTDKLSDYALVGYCEEAYRRTLKVENVSVNEPIIENGSGRFGTEGQGEAWGNTIDMHDMFNRLKSEYDALNGHTSVSYASSKTITHNTDGTDTEVGGSTSQHAVTVDGYRVRMTDQSSGNDDSYAFIQRTNVENNFIYLYGDKLIDTVQVTTTEIWKYDSFYIKDQGTDNYLAVSSNAAANATTAETAGKWVFEQDTATGKYAIFTIDSNTKKYLTANNGNLGISTTAFSGWEVNAAKTSISVNDHYLCWNSTDNEWELRSPPKNYICDTAENHYLSVQVNNGTPAIVDETDIDDATSWELDNGRIYIVINGINHYLTYDNDTDNLYVSDSEFSTWFANTDDQKGKIYVKLNDQNGRALYYDEINGIWKVTSFIIGVNSNTWGGTFNIRALNDRVYHLLNKTDNIIGGENQTDIITEKSFFSYYPSKYSDTYRKNNAAHRYYTDNNNTITHAVSSSAHNEDPNTSSYNIVYRFEDAGRRYNSNSGSTTDGYTELPGTVLPLAVDNDNNYQILSQNTGYIIGGMTGSGPYGTQTTIRSGAYGINFIGNSLSSAGVSSNSYVSSQLEVLTVDTTIAYNSSNYKNNYKRIIDDFNRNNTNYSSSISSYAKTFDAAALNKYDFSREQLEDVLNGQTKVHSLHFTGQSVSANSSDNIVTIQHAYMNGREYTNGFDMPKSCIDFYISESGYINFFAGSYMSSPGNNADSFFSLYTIDRNGSSISGLHEISAIYENNDANTRRQQPYYYVYSDGGNSSVGSRGQLLFNMEYLWNSPPVANAMYYFEIPVNNGEYAMGQHGSANNGAYLIYLDISTNAFIEGDAKIKSDGTAITATFSQSTGEVQISETQSRSENIETPPTFFPLLWDANDPTAVSADNKGYIISGANTVSNPPGDIRVSKYSRDTGTYNISRSLVNGVLTDSIMYTIDSGGLKTIAQYDPKNFCKYVSSKAQMQALLSDTNVYGLHFMDASVDMDNILTVPTAKLDGETYTKYEMPRNCIDINIENRGYINFFAGTFFDNLDDSFFSLHRIERYTSSDNIPTGKKVNDIKDIKEIRNIYQRTVNGSTEYLYQYEGESAPDASQGWEQIFDLNWIRQQQSSNIERNSVYYFEIPIDPGEYALGSVDGGTGAYLLYLDVCTTKGDAVVTSEKMTVE